MPLTSFDSPVLSTGFRNIVTGELYKPVTTNDYYRSSFTANLLNSSAKALTLLANLYIVMTLCSSV
ncbi:hypothetical protein ACVR1G_03930 [Streptococcus dentasini]